MEIIEVNTINAFLASFITSVSIILLSCSWCQDTCCIWWDKREVERDFLCVHTLWSRWCMSLLFLDYPGRAHGHNLMFRSPDHSIVLTTANLKRLLLTAYHRSHTWPSPHNWHASNDRHRLSVTKQLLALFFFPSQWSVMILALALLSPLSKSWWVMLWTSHDTSIQPHNMM